MKKLIVLALCCAFVPVAGAVASTDADSVRPDLRVQVRLNNGSSITGIVLEGRLVERRVRGFFKEAEDRTDRRSGIRVFYYRNANGFIFLQYRTIKDVKVLAEVTKEQKEALERAVAAAQREAARSRRQGSHGKPVKPGLGGLTESERKLLTKFDPTKGWTAERYGEIERRRIVEKKQPTKLEDEFCDVFSEWEAAYKKSTAAPKKGDAKGGESPKAPTEPKTSGS